MGLSALLEANVGFVHSVGEISILYLLNCIDNGTFIISEGNSKEEKDIPLEATVAKIIKGLPIQIISTAKIVEGKTCWEIVSGINEIKNIKDWIDGGAIITINGMDASFDALATDEKEFFLNFSRPIISTIIDVSGGLKRSTLKAGELAKIVKEYVWKRRRLWVC